MLHVISFLPPNGLELIPKGPLWVLRCNLPAGLPTAGGQAGVPAV